MKSFRVTTDPSMQNSVSSFIHWFQHTVLNVLQALSEALRAQGQSDAPVERPPALGHGARDRTNRHLLTPLTVMRLIVGKYVSCTPGVGTGNAGSGGPSSMLSPQVAFLEFSDSHNRNKQNTLEPEVWEAQPPHKA